MDLANLLREAQRDPDDAQQYLLEALAGDELSAAEAGQVARAIFDGREG